MKGRETVPEIARGKLLATRGDGAKLYQVKAGPDGGTVVIVNSRGEQSPVMKLGSVLAHNPYWDFIEPD